MDFFLKEQLTKFYHKDFCRIVDSFEIKEISPQAHTCTVNIQGDKLLIINKNFLQNDIFTKSNLFQLGDINDEIVIDTKNKTIYLFELKTTIWTRELSKAQMQLSATYLKLALYINLVADIQDFTLKLYLVGTLSPRLKDKNLALKNKKNDSIYMLEKFERKETYYFEQFPQKAFHDLNPLYQKRDVSFQYLLPNQTISVL